MQASLRQQSFTLDRYFISQSFLLIGSYGCLFAASLGLSLWRAEPLNDAELPNKRRTQQPPCS